jgi:hypothetical protein
MGFKPMQPPASLATDGLPAEIGDAGHNTIFGISRSILYMDNNQSYSYSCMIYSNT